MRHCFMRCVRAHFPLRLISGGGLEEATILADDLALGISCEGAESGGAVYDGAIEAADIDDGE